MTPWTWYAGHLDDDVYDLAEATTREKVIEAALEEVTGWLNPGDRFRIIEARSSDAKKYEGADFVPFLRTRNAEIIEIGEPS
ncbi:hypothetical protein [Brucella tritici]|uniref:Uncharacterized protein n=1 Tax=Brucella tritici TaxID=94626 RepID=A0A6L3Y9X9_9HYPH|nr:hypothetical protein [Brucella tritici]KAB2680526.1 hypothetical protein F9L08_20975 [Brucella tritici]